MKNPFTYLIPVIYQTLKAIPGIGVYDGMAPSNATSSYIIISTRSYTQEQDKNGFTGEASVLIDCVAKGADMGFEDSETLANDVTALINSDNKPDCSPNFQVVTVMVGGLTNVSGLNPSDKVFRTLVRYVFKISQL